MSRLEKKLNSWVENKLITPEQKEQISEFESKDKKPHLLFSLFCLGIFVISLGVISLVSANWDNINDIVKLIFDFAILSLLVWGIWQAGQKQKPFWQEAGIFALFLMMGASIGLIAQVFQTSGNLANAFLMWAFFTLPLLAVSRHKLLPLFWVPTLVCGIVGQHSFWLMIDRLFLWLHISPITFFTAGIVFWAILVFAFYLFNLYFRQRYPVFAVLRGYAEVLLYGQAFALLFMERDDFFLGLLITLFTFACAAAIYYAANQRRMLNLNIVFIGISFIIVFIRIFYNLLFTGFGLIYAGTVIMAIGWVVKKVLEKTALAWKGSK